MFFPQWTLNLKDEKNTHRFLHGLSYASMGIDKKIETISEYVDVGVLCHFFPSIRFSLHLTDNIIYNIFPFQVILCVRCVHCTQRATETHAQTNRNAIYHYIRICLDHTSDIHIKLQVYAIVHMRALAQLDCWYTDRGNGSGVFFFSFAMNLISLCSLQFRLWFLNEPHKYRGDFPFWNLLSIFIQQQKHAFIY